MNWNDFAKEVHQVAVEHGWWEKRPSFAEITVMIHTELSEAVEEYRLGRPMLYYPCNAGGLCEYDKPGDVRMDCGSRVFDPKRPEIMCKAKSDKPCGVAVELADCILRILDMMAEAGVDIDAEMGFNPAYKDVIQTIALCHVQISEAYIHAPRTEDCPPPDGVYTRLLVCVETIMQWARINNVPMEAIIQIKNKYNKTRQFRHGGKKL